MKNIRAFIAPVIAAACLVAAAACSDNNSSSPTAPKVQQPRANGGTVTIPPLNGGTPVTQGDTAKGECTGGTLGSGNFTGC